MRTCNDIMDFCIDSVLSCTIRSVSLRHALVLVDNCRGYLGVSYDYHLYWLIPPRDCGTLSVCVRVDFIISTTTAERRGCVCACVFFPFTLDVKFVGCTSRGHTGFRIHLPSAVHAFILLSGRIQPFLSLVDREVEFCVLKI